MNWTQLLLAAATLSSVIPTNAGDWDKRPVPPKEVIDECLDLGGQVRIGYESDYLFKGVRFAGDSAWVDVNYTFDGLAMPITVGTWYLNGIDDASGGSGFGPGYDELNLYASASLGEFAGFALNFGYTHYVFPEFRSNVFPAGGYGEVGLDLSKSLGWIDLILATDYALGGGGMAPSGWFHQIGVERSFGLTDRIDAVLGAGVAYSDGYYGLSDWNHYYATLSLPIRLNCRTTLTPYLGYSGAANGMVADGIAVGSVGTPQSDILHGGVSLSVSF